MIFCKRCGRYYNDGTASCGACGANLATHGDECLQGKKVKVIQDYPARTPMPVSAPRPAKTSAPASAPPPVSEPRRESTAVALLEPPVETELETHRDAVHPVTDPVFDRNKFLLRQKALAIKEKYYVTDESGSNLLFVERPALLTQQILMLAAVAATFFGGTFAVESLGRLLEPTLGATLGQIFPIVGFLAVLALTVVVFVRLVPKRHVTFYKDDTKRERVLEIKQLNKIEFPYANFSILDAAGNLIGSLRKNMLFDYVRRRWQVKDANGIELCMAKEDSIILSLLRRTNIPIFVFLRTNFIFLRRGEVIGEFNRKFTLLDRYVLDLTADTQQALDRRIALALGVMLDTGERR